MFNELKKDIEQIRKIGEESRSDIKQNEYSMAKERLEQLTQMVSKVQGALHEIKQSVDENKGEKTQK